jgi:hypothetical protein
MDRTTFSERHNGKTITDTSQVSPDLPSWKRRAIQPLMVEGVALSRFILEERGVAATDIYQALQLLKGALPGVDE